MKKQDNLLNKVQSWLTKTGSSLHLSKESGRSYSYLTGKDLLPADFSYEKEHQNLFDYFKNNAFFDGEESLNKTIICRENEAIRGLVTFSCSSVDVEGEKFPLPGVLIGKLLVCSSCKGKGIGSELVKILIAICAEKVKPFIGCRMIIVDSAKEAVGFYENIGFEKIPNRKSGRTVQMYYDLENID